MPFVDWERLRAVFDGARYVSFADNGAIFVWQGGHGIHVFTETLHEVNLYNVGDFARNEATLEEVRQGIADILREEQET